MMCEVMQQESVGTQQRGPRPVFWGSLVPKGNISFTSLTSPHFPHLLAPTEVHMRHETRKRQKQSGKGNPFFMMLFGAVEMGRYTGLNLDSSRKLLIKGLKVTSSNF